MVLGLQAHLDAAEEVLVVPVHDVADQVQGVGIVAAQEVEQVLGLAAGRAQVHVRNPDRAISAGSRPRRPAPKGPMPYA